MNYKLTHRITAALVFIISAAQFLLTVQPSVSFWDCGEFIAAGYSMQVPHPPGAPLFLLLGRIFSMMPFLGGNIAYRVNLISVFSSALSVLLLYLVAVKLIENFRGKQPKNMFDALVTYVAAAIGALSFSFSDTFWFNGVEAEVYAASTFLFALITWIIMIWNEKADRPDNEKYLLMIAYLVGLSTGVHLMSVLAFVPVVMVVLFRKYVEDEEACKKTGYIFLAHSAVILLIAIGMWGAEKGTVPPIPEEYQAFDSKFKWIAVAISAIIMGAFWKKIFNRNSFYLPLIIGGIALGVSYPGVVKVLPSFLKAVSGDSATGAFIGLAAILAAIGYLVYWSVKNNKPTVHLASMSLLFVILGFTTYAMVIIRSNQQPPMNENEPNDFTELVSYLNREQYGDFPTFKRRFASEPHQMVVYNNYSSDLEFFWKYQMDHMFNRYLFWNYIGREGWVQDQGVDWKQLYGIPFLVGLFGIFFHFRKDWKMASVFMVAFIFMGYLTAFYQNQQEPQPRERDYFYVGAFFVYSIWVALGIRGIVELAAEMLRGKSAASADDASPIGESAAVKGVAFAVLGLGIVLIPFNMARTNWFTHDRSKNWVPWDYAYNVLQSCAPNAVLFTNGDNDTFPLWYLQDVEGVRRDVRIANLSLLNTNWYIKQLKNTSPYGSLPVAISYSDEFIDQMQPSRWEAQTVSLPVPKEVLDQYTMKDPSLETPVPRSFAEQYGTMDSTIMRTGNLTFRMNPTIGYGDVRAIRVQDLMVKDIIQSNKWKRPVYFAVTCSEDSKIGLQDYLIMEGLAYRLVPVRRKSSYEFTNAHLLRQMLYSKDEGYSKTYKPGFKFRGLDDKSIFFDENHERLTQNYRTSFMSLALYYLYTEQNKALCTQTLDEMEKRMPSEVISMPLGLRFAISNIYFASGAMDQYRKSAAELERISLENLKNNPNDVSTPYNPYRVLSEIYENLGKYDKAVELFTRLQNMYPNDQGVKNELDRFRMLAAGNRDTSSANKR